ncbi:uncharacterized protein EV420DRAFT_355565 [Desarmillaria tabescens]|uniref:Uncharacterized protein n=1 Tax=Armillaria tabescens TaxID=1929756 RepID=A0AA39KC79_ARMTA|nr:uncharacterized protein EV420DRAFT_355565 [Desarmillaria tabescens]KAK0458440.1 hypothetical protein EV420DRAFT_355565 [Desarmillaria tabescens]
MWPPNLRNCFGAYVHPRGGRIRYIVNRKNLSLSDRSPPLIMTTQTEIPDLSDDDKALMFQTLGVYLNQTLVSAYLQGLYTGIAIFTLWKIFSKERSISRTIMALVVLILCILAGVSCALYWTYTVYSFIHHGQNFWTVISAFDIRSDMAVLIRVGLGVVGCVSTLVADSAMVWRCWMVWGRRWTIILLPLVFMIIGLAFKILQTRVTVQGTTPVINYQICTTIYISLILATTLLCTLLIVYRILSIEWAKPKPEGTRRYSLGAYRNLIEIVVESSALYSAVLIVYIIFVFQDEIGGEYLDPIAEFIRGVAPTLLVGRIASGLSRPDDAWKGSVLSSLQFGSRRRAHTDTETRTEDLTFDDDFVHDVEVQAGQPDEENTNVCQCVEPELVVDEGV